jgi:uncharacterized protein YjlB
MGAMERTMYIVENLKRKFEQVTGMGKPSKREARAAVRKAEPQEFMFGDDGVVPNNPTLPFLVYKRAIELDDALDPAALFEELFAANGWGSSWRNGVYRYVHYHSMVHEVLGIARGHARVRFGGDGGTELELEPGDVAVLPAGTGHQCLEASRDFLVVGAYPSDGEYDECRGEPQEYACAKGTIPRVETPTTDPLLGRTGPLTRLWMR